MNVKDEPVRLSGWSALGVGLCLLAVIGWTQGLDVRAIAGQVAVVALTSIGGLEFARARVSPFRSGLLHGHDSGMLHAHSEDGVGHTHAG